MKLRDALRKVAALKGKISTLESRARSVVTWTSENNEPEWKFDEVIDELSKCRSDLIDITSKMRETNANVQIEDPNTKRMISLTRATKVLSELRAEISFYDGLSFKNGIEKFKSWDYDDEGRRVRLIEEITHNSALTEKTRAARIEELREKFAMLNSAVEAANGMADMLRDA